MVPMCPILGSPYIYLIVCRQAIEAFYADPDTKMVIIYEVTKGDLTAVS